MDSLRQMLLMGGLAKYVPPLVDVWAAAKKYLWNTTCVSWNTRSNLLHQRRQKRFEKHKMASWWGRRWQQSKSETKTLLRVWEAEMGATTRAEPSKWNNLQILTFGGNLRGRGGCWSKKMWSWGVGICARSNYILASRLNTHFTKIYVLQMKAQCSDNSKLIM